LVAEVVDHKIALLVCQVVRVEAQVAPLAQPLVVLVHLVKDTQEPIILVAQLGWVQVAAVLALQQPQQIQMVAQVSHRQ
jgi:hypothetical protein